MNISPEKLYSTEQLAQILSVSLITVKRYIKNDTISSLKINGIRRVKGSDVIELLNKPKSKENKTHNNHKKGIQFYWSQKDPQIAHNIYKRHCKKNHIIMDPFLGAGSSLYGIRGLENLKLKFIGVDINEMPLNSVRFNCLKKTNKLIVEILNKIDILEKKIWRFLYIQN